MFFIYIKITLSPLKVKKIHLLFENFFVFSILFIQLKNDNILER
jgi:hypothetical protein